MIKIKRLIAIYIDYIIWFYSCYFLLNANEMLFENIVLKIFFAVVIMLIGFNLFLRKDTIFGYTSIGKKIMRLKIYDEKGEQLTNKKKLLDRVFYSLWPFPIYPIMVLWNNQSNGDKKIKTEVR